VILSVIPTPTTALLTYNVIVTFSAGISSNSFFSCTPASWVTLPTTSVVQGATTYTFTVFALAAGTLVFNYSLFDVTNGAEGTGYLNFPIAMPVAPVFLYATPNPVFDNTSYSVVVTFSAPLNKGSSFSFTPASWLTSAIVFVPGQTTATFTMNATTTGTATFAYDVWDYLTATQSNSSSNSWVISSAGPFSAPELVSVLPVPTKVGFSTATLTFSQPLGTKSLFEVHPLSWLVSCNWTPGTVYCYLELNVTGQDTLIITYSAWDVTNTVMDNASVSFAVPPPAPGPFLVPELVSVLPIPTTVGVDYKCVMTFSQLMGNNEFTITPALWVTNVVYNSGTNKYSFEVTPQAAEVLTVNYSVWDVTNTAENVSSISFPISVPVPLVGITLESATPEPDTMNRTVETVFQFSQLLGSQSEVTFAPAAWSIAPTVLYGSYISSTLCPLAVGTLTATWTAYDINNTPASKGTGTVVFDVDNPVVQVYTGILYPVPAPGQTIFAVSNYESDDASVPPEYLCTGYYYPFLETTTPGNVNYGATNPNVLVLGNTQPTNAYSVAVFGKFPLTLQSNFNMFTPNFQETTGLNNLIGVTAPNHVVMFQICFVTVTASAAENQLVFQNTYVGYTDDVSLKADVAAGTFHGTVSTPGTALKQCMPLSSILPNINADQFPTGSMNITCFFDWTKQTVCCVFNSVVQATVIPSNITAIINGAGVLGLVITNCVSGLENMTVTMSTALDITYIPQNLSLTMILPSAGGEEPYTAEQVDGQGLPMPDYGSLLDVIGNTLNILDEASSVTTTLVDFLEAIEKDNLGNIVFDGLEFILMALPLI
jgi:hypothetical protein